MDRSPPIRMEAVIALPTDPDELAAMFARDILAAVEGRPVAPTLLAWERAESAWLAYHSAVVAAGAQWNADEMATFHALGRDLVSAHLAWCKAGCPVTMD